MGNSPSASPSNQSLLVNTKTSSQDGSNDNLEQPLTPNTHSRRIENFLVDTTHSQQNEHKVKILLLGMGSSGKTTIISKLKKYISEQSNQDSLKEGLEDKTFFNKTFTDIIHFHALNGIKQLILASEKLDISIIPRHGNQKEAIEQAILKLRTLNFCYGESALNREIASQMTLLWNQKGSQEIYEEFLAFKEKNNNNGGIGISKHHKNDDDIKNVSAGEFSCFTIYKDLYTLKYFMDNIDRISESGYIPSDEDVEYCQRHLREDKKGIEEIEFEFSGSKFIIYCVEGQNNDGRKWLFLFQGVDIVLFLCPIGDYDLVPENLDRQNIVVESLNFFSKMCNSKWFRTTPIILLLTKWDLFQEKISKTSINVCFEDYAGGCDYLQSLKFILKKFNKVREDLGEETNTNIYQQVVTKDISYSDLANNIGGCLKSILYEQKSLKPKQHKEQTSPEVQQHNTTIQSPRNGELKNKLFSGLIKKLKK
ncbi:hypothetical protein ABK040_009791 [Willaertia magna]